MGRQGSLLPEDRSAYLEFGLDNYPDDYPFNKLEPWHPSFIRKGTVQSGNKNPRTYRVDLSIGECNCAKGYGWSWDSKGSKWYKTAICTHKLRVMCHIVEAAREKGSPELRDMEQAYLKALGTRYNPFETVSAFHKELRRGDFQAAWFWGLMLANKRGLRGVFMYMLNIIYEETRDHELAAHLLGVLGNQRMITLASLAQCISWFCASKKKWELPHRMLIFDAEMQGYNKLCDKYGNDVAKGGNIIETKARTHLLGALQNGLKTRDLVTFQYGLKGLQKLKYSEADKPNDDELQAYRYWLYEQLYELAEALLPDTHDAWAVIAVVNKRIEAARGIGYHELNAIADAIAGEPYSAGLLKPAKRKLHAGRPAPLVPLGAWPAIPLYAHDNHTYGGKALMRRFPEQLKPKAQQTDLDFRWCGAYFGVCFRMISFAQLGRVAEWHEVRWPGAIYKIVDRMWY